MKPNNVIVLVLMIMLILGFIEFYLGGFLFRRYHLWVRPRLHRTYDLEQAAQAAPGRAPSPSSSSDFSLNVLDLYPLGVGQWVANLPLEDIAEEEPELVEEEAAEQELLEEEEAGQEWPEEEEAGQEWPEEEEAGQEWPEGEGAGQEGPEGEEAGQEGPEGEGAGQESPEGDDGGHEWQEGDGAGQEWEEGDEWQEVDVAEQELGGGVEEVPGWAVGPAVAGPAEGAPVVGLGIYLD